MPIYAYRCESCGHSQDVMQKLSDAPLTTCPQCSAAAFRKQLTAPAFQLKGTGWYVTDFRDNGKPKGKPDEGGEGGGKSETAEKTDAAGKSDDSGKGDSGKGDSGKGEAGKGEAGKTAGGAAATTAGAASGAAPAAKPADAPVKSAAASRSD